MFSLSNFSLLYEIDGRYQACDLKWLLIEGLQLSFNAVRDCGLQFHAGTKEGIERVLYLIEASVYGFVLANRRIWQSEIPFIGPHFVIVVSTVQKPLSTGFGHRPSTKNCRLSVWPRRFGVTVRLVLTRSILRGRRVVVQYLAAVIEPFSGRIDSTRLLRFLFFVNSGVQEVGHWFGVTETGQWYYALISSWQEVVKRRPEQVLIR